jgi:hypothetical protein
MTSVTGSGEIHAYDNAVRRFVLLVLAVVIAIAIGGVLWMRSGPSAAQFAHLKDPRFTRLPDARMLVVQATGDPNVVAGQAFRRLFSLYYKLDRVSRWDRPPAPRARWPRPAETPKDQWVGHYALPIPAGAVLPSGTETSKSSASIATWQYGEVVELLHIGPYSTEEPDIRRLNEFVGSRGYRPVGEHEEEYVRGPGMIFAGDRDKYLTIIRLRVEREPISP